jgi:hypothetical protein
MDLVKWRPRGALEAKAKDGVYDHIKALLQGRAVCDVLGCQEGDLA